MQFKKLVKAEGIYEKYRQDMDRAESDYKHIEESYKVLHDILLKLRAATFDVYQTSVTTDNKELVAQAKKACEMADDASWDKISKLHQAILDIIYKK